MRDLTKFYDHVYVDIDDTLIYGFWTDLMKHTWNIFRNDALSQIMMYLQARFSLFKVNHKLIRMLGNSTKVTFLTVRAPSFYTYITLANALKQEAFIAEIVALGTDDGAFAKAEFMAEEMHKKGYQKICLVDDSPANRDMAQSYGFDVYNPTGMYEKLVA